MRFMQIESVLQTINRSEPAKNRFSVALVRIIAESKNIMTINLKDPIQFGMAQKAYTLFTQSF